MVLEIHIRQRLQVPVQVLIRGLDLVPLLLELLESLLQVVLHEEVPDKVFHLLGPFCEGLVLVLFFDLEFQRVLFGGLGKLGEFGDVGEIALHAGSRDVGDILERVENVSF